jgi:diadenylate cyclase
MLPLHLIRTVLDILIVSFIFYQILTLIKGTRAVQMFIGVIVLVLASLGAQLLQLQTVNWLLKNLWGLWVVIMIIIFQPEIREALVQMGRKQGFFYWWGGDRKFDYLNKIIQAVEIFSHHHHGALIVIEQKIGLKQYIEAGIKLDSEISVELLTSLLYPHTALHDGGIIIRRGRLAAAGCYFPLTQKPEISKTLGGRHRAAIGITEETDAIAIVVSEEKGKISLAQNGKLTSFKNSAELKEKLESLFPFA